ncbi:hypothetical protein XFF6992_460047 [Xanthomonas citri pv. fuscans]|nr:hypothetical protein XFF6992_460047 [Xanthomonas citri pv. fuscans]
MRARCRAIDRTHFSLSACTMHGQEGRELLVDGCGPKVLQKNLTRRRTPGTLEFPTPPQRRELSCWIWMSC